MADARSVPPEDMLKGEAYIWGCNNGWNYGAAEENPQRVLRQVLRQSSFFSKVDASEYEGIIANAYYERGRIEFTTSVGEYEIFDDENAAQYVRNYVEDTAYDVQYVLLKSFSDPILHYIAFDEDQFIRDIYLGGEDTHIIDIYGDGIDEVSIWGIDMDTHTGGGVKEYIVVNVRRTY